MGNARSAGGGGSRLNAPLLQRCPFREWSPLRSRAGWAKARRSGASRRRGGCRLDEMNLGQCRDFDNPEYSEGVIWIYQTMARIQLTELTAFVAAGEHPSITQAAAPGWNAL